jgi:hypothetical protein
MCIISTCLLQCLVNLQLHLYYFWSFSLKIIFISRGVATNAASSDCERDQIMVLQPSHAMLACHGVRTCFLWEISRQLTLTKPYGDGAMERCGRFTRRVSVHALYVAMSCCCGITKLNHVRARHTACFPKASQPAGREAAAHFTDTAALALLPLRRRLQWKQVIRAD